MSECWPAEWPDWTGWVATVREYKHKHKHKQLGERDWMNGMEHESEQGVHGGCQSGRSVASDR